MAKLTREEVIAKVKAGKSLKGKNLSGLDLREVNFFRINLEGANLRNANLIEVEFDEVNLSMADLGGAYLYGAKFHRTNLSAADLSNADLREVEFIGINLEMAVLCMADLEMADLRRANLSGANLNMASMTKADLRMANFSKANLSAANLSYADLGEARLNEADLTEADFREAKLEKADLSKAKLIKSYFVGANLNKVKLRECDLRSANFATADLYQADLTGANIWNIANTNWEIDKIICEYVYNSNCRRNDEKERTRRNFAPGEFEQLYKSFPKLELIFREEYSGLDHKVLLAIIDRINQELPQANLKLRKIERVIDTTATLTAKTEDAVEKAAGMLPEQYARITAELEKIKPLFSRQNPNLLLPDWLTQANEIIKQPTDKLINLPSIVINNYQINAPCTLQIGDNNQFTIQQQTQIINNLLDRLDSPNFEIELDKANQEFQSVYDKLDDQGKADLLAQTRKIITEKPGFIERLKKCGKWAVKEGWDISKSVLINILSEVAKGKV